MENPADSKANMSNVSSLLEENSLRYSDKQSDDRPERRVSFNKTEE